MKVVFSVILFFLVMQLFSVPLETLVPAHVQQLRSNREAIVEAQLRNPAPVLLPNNRWLQQLVSETMNNLNPNMLIESLYLYNKHESLHTASDSWDPEQRNIVFNQMLAISTLTGIQYYSASRREMRTFYEYSSVIDNPQARNPQPDPVFRRTILPANPQSVPTLIVRQRDLTFGDNIYSYDYFLTGDAVYFIQENITALNYGIFPVIGRGNLRSVLAVVDCGDSILIYTASMVRAMSLPGMNDRIRDSFTNRAHAVLGWFTGRLDSHLQ